MGNSSNTGVLIQNYTGVFGHAADNITMTNCTFNNCNYGLLAESSPYTGTFTFQNNLFASSINCNQFNGNNSAHYFAVAYVTSAQTNGGLLDCTFDGRVCFDHMIDWTIESYRCVLQGNATGRQRLELFQAHVH